MRCRIGLFTALSCIFMFACGGGSGSSHSTQPPTVTPSQVPVTISTTGLAVAILNQPYADAIQASPSGFKVTEQGNLPPGITMDNLGQFSGKPTQTGVYTATYTVQNSSGAIASRTFTLQVVNPGTVRNDTLANATVLACCGTVRASLSPYSTAAGIAAPDQDYYRITANPGDKISIDAVSTNSLIDTDTVIEVLDVNGNRMNVCNTPQSATTNFSFACLNDDINPGIVRNSHLDIQLPSTSGVFVVHVLDWLGRARPEMTYELRTVKLQ